MREALNRQSSRVLYAHPFDSDHEESCGTRMVNIAISDGLEIIANINVTRTELLAALGVEE